MRKITNGQKPIKLMQVIAECRHQNKFMGILQHPHSYKRGVNSPDCLYVPACR
jgi:hypothetical protein